MDVLEEERKYESCFTVWLWQWHSYISFVPRAQNRIPHPPDLDFHHPGRSSWIVFIWQLLRQKSSGELRCEAWCETRTSHRMETQRAFWRDIERKLGHEVQDNGHTVHEQKKTKEYTIIRFWKWTLSRLAWRRVCSFWWNEWVLLVLVVVGVLDGEGEWKGSLLARAVHLSVWQSKDLALHVKLSLVSVIFSRKLIFLLTDPETTC